MPRQTTASVGNALGTLFSDYKILKNTVRNTGSYIQIEMSIQKGDGPIYSFSFDSDGKLSGSVPPDKQAQVAKRVATIPSLIRQNAIRY
tara:strand:+ start:5769 stop:6035 length:267 start_codon:yes stop_codon:yes gene_type:complete